MLLRRVYEGQQQLTHQAYHDPLTGLANRALFADRLDRAVEQGGEDGHRPLVLIFVDLDDFKDVQRPVRARGRGRPAAFGRPAAA